MSGANRIATAGRRGMWLGGPRAAAWPAVPAPGRPVVAQVACGQLITASTTVGNDLAG
jgi:hypothetical protein